MQMQGSQCGKSTEPTFVEASVVASKLSQFGCKSCLMVGVKVKKSFAKEMAVYWSSTGKSIEVIPEIQYSMELRRSGILRK
jgi:hypothetical protein